MAKIENLKERLDGVYVQDGTRKGEEKEREMKGGSEKGSGKEGERERERESERPISIENLREARAFED